MRKKVLVLTESQIKRVLSKIVAEQTVQGNQEKRPPFQPNTPDVTFKLPGIIGVDDYQRFRNLDGMSHIEKAKDLFNKSGLNFIDMATKENEAIKKDINLRGKTTPWPFILNSIMSFLGVVAKINPKLEGIGKTNILALMDNEMPGYNFQEYLPIIFGSEGTTGITIDKFWDGLTKLAQTKISSLTQKTT